MTHAGTFRALADLRRVVFPRSRRTRRRRARLSPCGRRAVAHRRRRRSARRPVFAHPGAARRRYLPGAAHRDPGRPHPDRGGTFCRCLLRQRRVRHAVLCLSRGPRLQCRSWPRLGGVAHRRPRHAGRPARSARLRRRAAYGRARCRARKNPASRTRKPRPPRCLGKRRRPGLRTGGPARRPAQRWCRPRAGRRDRVPDRRRLRTHCRPPARRRSGRHRRGRR